MLRFQIPRGTISWMDDKVPSPKLETQDDDLEVHYPDSDCKRIKTGDGEAAIISDREVQKLDSVNQSIKCISTFLQTVDNQNADQLFLQQKGVVSSSNEESIDCDNEVTNTVDYFDSHPSNDAAKSKMLADVDMINNSIQSNTILKEGENFPRTKNNECINESDFKIDEIETSSMPLYNLDITNMPQSSVIDNTSPLNRQQQMFEPLRNSVLPSNVEKYKVDMFNYHLKWFEWKGEQTPIVTQNENGPCPLLAIANVLILARKINLPKMQQLISGKQLMEYVGDCILAETPKQENNEELMLNYEQNMQDAIDIMHKLQTGIDVNVKFSGVTDFEFTPECIVFDLLKIQLYHGWLIDPQDLTHIKAIGGLSYNQLVEKMLLNKDADGDDVVEGVVIEEFLTRTASQLTYHGLCELNTTIEEEELCVFFRNNHFSTLYKHKGELFLLITDQGYLAEPAVVWETLVNIDGDGQFVNSNFVSVTIQSENTATVGNTSGDIPRKSMSQEDRDYLIALSMQEDPQPAHQSDETFQNMPTIDRDHELAMKLQENENRLAQQQQKRQQQQLQQRQKQQLLQQKQQLQQQQQQQQQQQPHPQLQQDINTRTDQQSESTISGGSRNQQQGDLQQPQDKEKCIIL